MKREKEAQTAWEIWNLINRLNDLLFDRYEEEFSNLWLKEGEEDPFLQPLGTPDPPEVEDKKDTAP
jgi:hypothetical protein